MKLLAIDTSSDACSVALCSGADVIEQHVVKPRVHAEILIPMIESLLLESGLALSDLDAVVLGNGPGSFIGMRIGASVAQGICFGSGLDIVPISSLAAIAAEVIEEHGGEKIVVAQDARMHEVYVGRYARASDDLPVAVAEDEICPIGELAGLCDSYTAAGGAWKKFPQLQQANQRWVGAYASVVLPRARFLLQLGAQGVRSGAAIAPELLRPAYIRVKVAEKPTLAPPAN